MCRVAQGEVNLNPGKSKCLALLVMIDTWIDVAGASQQRVRPPSDTTFVLSLVVPVAAALRAENALHLAGCWVAKSESESGDACLPCAQRSVFRFHARASCFGSWLWCVCHSTRSGHCGKQRRRLRITPSRPRRLTRPEYKKINTLSSTQLRAARSLSPSLPVAACPPHAAFPPTTRLRA